MSFFGDIELDFSYWYSDDLIRIEKLGFGSVEIKRKPRRRVCGTAFRELV